MKTLFQIHLLLISFLLFSQKVIATGVPVFSGDDVEVWVVKPCSPSSSYGRIDLRILSENSPYTIHYHKMINGSWSPLTPGPIPVINEGEEDLLNIGPGMYKVEIWDKSCGYVELEIDMEQGEESSIHFQEFFRSLPTGCNTSDGKIEPCKVAGTIYGGIPPFNYQWSNGATSCNISNLPNGIYTLTVTDALGCKNEKAVDLFIEDAIVIEFEEIKQPCVNAINGKIDIQTNTISDFIWSVPGDNSNENSSSLHDLSPGTYCVTILDPSTGCSMEKCYELNGIPANSPVNISDVIISKPCINESNGRISLNVNDGNYPLSYTWYIPTINQYKYTSQLNQIQEGLYLITVTDVCEHKSTREILVEPSVLDMNYVLDHGCGWTFKGPTNELKIKESGIDVTVIGDNSPFNLEVKDLSSGIKNTKVIPISNGSGTFQDLFNSNYNITIKDSKNCIISEQIQLQPVIIYHEGQEDFDEPCKDTNSGSISFRIENPRSLKVKANIWGLEVFNSNKINDIFLLENISENMEIRLIFEAEGCEVNYYNTFKLQSKPTDKVYSRYDSATNTCFYNEECEGTTLVIDSYLEFGRYDYFDNNTNYSKCEVPIKCRDEIVKWVDRKHSVIYGAQYALLLESLLGVYPYNQDSYILQQDLDRVNDGKPCDIWEFCPITLRLKYPHSSWWIASLCQAFNDPNWEELEAFVDDNGCIDTKDCFCGDFPELICPAENLPLVNINRCRPRRMNLAKLIIFEDQLARTYSGYVSGTELYNFIHNTVLPDSELRKKSVCTNISFCTTDFRVLRYPQFEYADCDYPSDILSPNGWRTEINEEGKLINRFSDEKYNTCEITDSGISICLKANEVIFCKKEEGNNEPIPQELGCDPRYALQDTVVVTDNRIVGCDDSILSIINNPLQNNYTYFWEAKRDSNYYLVIQERSNNQTYISDKQPTNYFSKDEITSVNIDKKYENIYIVSKVNGINDNVSNVDLSGNVNWKLNFLDLDINHIDANNLNQIKIIGYDRHGLVWNKILVSKDGTINNITNLPIDTFRYQMVREIFSSIITYHQNGTIQFFKEGNIRSLILPENCKVYDIKHDKEKIIMTGNFIGIAEIGGYQIQSLNYSNVFFFVFDLDGNIIKVHHEIKDRHEYVSGVDINYLDEIIYHGKYFDSIPYPNVPNEFMIDSCIFVSKFSLRDSCMINLNRILYQDSCFLRWDIPENHFDAILQFYQNDVWKDVSGINEEANIQYHYPKQDAFYRVLFNSNSCNDTLSNVVEVKCKQNNNLFVNCLDTLVDIAYDSLGNSFHLFFGMNSHDTIFGETFTFDTIQGYLHEFTRHRIVWDSIKFVRYDSTRTVYYFGTDSTRSFITSIDSTGSLFTQWFENIRFLSCSPANKKGIWHIVGYHITENRYYLYQFDKKFLTLHPTVIPNPERGQTYTKFWSFGPAEYVSTIRSGQYTAMKFVSNAVPPMDVALPHPFVVKTVVKWQNNQWLVTGDLNGTMVIAGDTIISEEWTKSIFIWYDWTGTVIKYKVIESEDDRIITHVATDGFEKILFTGMTIDTIFNETLDSFTIETCIFGDTITIDGIPTLFKGHQPDLTSSVEAVLQEDQTFVRFYPNPFKSGINLRIDSPVLDKISLHVTSVLGTTVLTKDLDISEGRNEIYLQEFESLPGGLYTVWIKKSTGEKAFKVIKIE